LGESTMTQELPSQRSTNVSASESDVEWWPTAQHSEPDAHVTPERALSRVALLLGEPTMAHEVPFQRSIKVRVVDPAADRPTAQQSDADTHVTSLR
jgi:hypothetical protein